MGHEKNSTAVLFREKLWQHMRSYRQKQAVPTAINLKIFLPDRELSSGGSLLNISCHLLYIRNGLWQYDLLVFFFNPFPQTTHNGQFL